MLCANGSVRALAIETDEAPSEALRMSPGETIPFDHVVGGRLQEATSAYRDGQRARALECHRKVLEVLPRDEKADEAAKGQLRANAERQVRELLAAPSSRR